MRPILRGGLVAGLCCGVLAVLVLAVVPEWRWRTKDTLLDVFHMLPFTGRHIVSGVAKPYSDLRPLVVHADVPEAFEAVGGIIAFDLDSDLGGSKHLIITAPGYISVRTPAGRELWARKADIQVTSKAERDGLPGLHGAGVQARDVDGDGGAEVLFLSRANQLVVLDGATGKSVSLIDLPAPPAAAEGWEHLVLAQLRGPGKVDLILQATNEKGYRRGKFVAAFAMEDLLGGKKSASPLWQRDDYKAIGHSGLRVADLDGDGRDEVLGWDVLDADGEVLHSLPASGHIDSLTIADVRPDLPGLEVVALEESHKVPQRVFLYNREGLIWDANYKHLEPQNSAVGEFDLSRPGLEIWCRSRFDRYQKPWVFDAFGALISKYALATVAPKGWSIGGVEEISAIHWTGGAVQMAAAKERHTVGDVVIFNPISGAFLHRIKARAKRLYVADVVGDWREELVVWTDNEIRVYGNLADNPNPGHASLWKSAYYRGLKQNWNYYQP